MKTKVLLSAVVVSIMVVSGFLGIFYILDADAGDVGSEPLERFNQSGVGSDINKIAWSTDGTWGLAVATQGRVWVVTESSLASDPFMGAPDSVTDPGDTLYGVAYDPIGLGFYVVGDGAVSGNAIWYYPSGGPIAPTLNDPDAGGLRGIAVAGADYMVVGDTGRAFFWDGGFSQWNYAGSSIPGPAAPDNFMDVSFSKTGGANAFMVVGNNAGDGIAFTISLADAQTSAGQLVGGVINPGFGDAFKAVDSYVGGLSVDRFIVVGDKSSIYVLDHNRVNITRVYPSYLWGNTKTFWGVAVDPASGPAGADAVIVGEETGVAELIKYSAKNGVHDAFPASDPTNVMGLPGAIGILRAVAFKPASSPAYWVIIGSNDGLRYYQTEVGQPIQVDTLYPHVDYMNVYSDYGGPGESTVLNSKVDVWTGGDTLTLVVEGSHKNGWDLSVDYMDFYIWFDNGLTGTNSRDAMFLRAGDPVDNTYAHFRYTNVVGPANPGLFSTVGGAGNNEIVLLGGTDTGIMTGPNTDDTKDYRITLEFYFNVQAWATPGDPLFNEGIAGPTLDQTTAGTGLNDAGTWDLMVDLVALDNGGSDSRFDELGVYVYQAFVASGMPGSMRGQGPPNSNISLTTTGNSHASFVSNHNYRFGVYVVDIFYGDDNPVLNQIDITEYGTSTGDNGLAVAGGLLDSVDIDVPLTNQFYTSLGFAGVQYLVDDGFGGYVSPNTRGTYTTCGDDTVNTAWAGAGGTAVNDIAFRVRVGNVAEDNYRTTVVYLLTHMG